MKTFDSNGLIFVWLLPLAAGVAQTSGPYSQSQLTPHMSVALTPTADTNPPSLPAAQSVTTPQSAGASTPQTTTSDESSISPRPDTASTATLPSSQPSAAPSSSTSTQRAAMSSTAEFSTSHTTSHTTPSSEILTSPLTTSVKTEDSTITRVQATTGTGMLTFRSTRKTSTREEKESNSGKIVAGLIGGALALMMVGFLVIYIKKQRIQKQQITVTDWAGPSPFLQDERDGGPVTQRPSNRISIANFLPHRLSKRLSLLQDMEQELKDMSPAVTFGHEGQGKDSTESNGLSASDTKTQSDNGEPLESPSSPSEGPPNPGSDKTKLEKDGAPPAT